MDIFSHREIATYSWLLLLILWIFSSSKIRPAAIGVVRAFFARQLVGAYTLLVLYVSAIVAALSHLGIWNEAQLKNTILWTFTVAISVFFRLKGEAADKDVIKAISLDNFKFLMVLEFLVSFYSLPLFWEFLLVPFLAFLGLMIAVAESDTIHAAAKKVLDAMLVAMGSVLLIHAVINLARDFYGFFNSTTLADFYIPPLLTILYLPFLLFLSLYSGYQRVFAILERSFPNKKVFIYAQVRAFLAFHIRLRLLDLWKNSLIRNYANPTYKDIDRSIREILEMHKAERNPQPVNPREGWSPYEAAAFLSPIGMETNGYVRFFEDEWGASSNYLELNGFPLKNNIGYYLDGTKNVAKKLKIKLNINQPECEESDLESYCEVAEFLYLKAFKALMPEQLKTHILEKRDLTFIGPLNSDLVIKKTDWPSHSYNGYGMTFEISKRVHTR
jgi:hypothetical protein